MKARNLTTALAILAGLSVLTAAPALAQTTPTGTITGTVVDAQGGLLPGVSVTASSPSLQGTRTAVTSKNGDYIIPFLPAGEYTVKFELSGFTPTVLNLRVQLAETVPLTATLAVGGLTEQVTVTAQVNTDFTSPPPRRRATRPSRSSGSPWAATSAARFSWPPAPPARARAGTSPSPAPPRTKGSSSWTAWC